MTSFKKFAILGTFFGGGFAVVVLLSMVGYSLYRNQPRPPKTWDTEAVKATFVPVDTEGERNTVVFTYTLENTISGDIELREKENVRLMGRLEGDEGLDSNEGLFEKEDLPLFIPEKQKVSYKIHRAAPYPGVRLSSRAGEGESGRAVEAHQKAVAAWVRDKFPNLNGFALFDRDTLYEIVFPEGW